MRVFCILPVLLLMSGCITLGKVNKIDSYVAKTPGLSAEIVTAMRNGVVIKGMNAEQVTLVWGKPKKKKMIPTGGGDLETIWYYYDKEKVSNLDTSSLFALDSPSKRVSFDKNMLVYEYRLNDEELDTSRITAMTGTLPGSMLGKSMTADGKPIFRAGEFKGWPTIVLSKIIETGANGVVSLNGTIVGVGEKVSGVKVLAVGTLGVKLEYKDQIGLLKKGESTK